MRLLLLLFGGAVLSSLAQTHEPFDGRPWNISSGNLSVGYIQASPIGAFPRANFLEAPPSAESQIHLKALGLVANEDYIAWGAVERKPGQWDWQQHDAIEQTLHRAGLKYVVYDWVHFPPVWLRDQQPEKRTLMRCLEHGQEANYLSIFDPRTIEWYDHFYKNLHEHFGDRIDDVYACILGPYGEGNYPLEVTAWVKMGHCHEGYWCGDAFAVRAFQSAMRQRYPAIAKLNRAWGANYRSFDEVRPPHELAGAAVPGAPALAGLNAGHTAVPLGDAVAPKPAKAGAPVDVVAPFTPSPAAFPTAQDKRRWLDFITWYHQALINFTEQSVRTVLKYFPAEKVRLKPGGNAGGVNPIAWGTYCPGYAKMAQPYHIVLQPADCQGAVFGDKWVGAAYQFYGVKECTEPAGGLDEKAFVRRMFSDASSGARQLFTYEFEAHAATIRRYIHLFTGKPGDTQIAVYCPTTLYRLGGNLQPTIAAAYPLRDLCEFDVLDELLIADGALTPKHYRVLLIFQADIVEQAILDKIDRFRRAGGKVIVIGDGSVNNVEGRAWRGLSRCTRVPPVAKDRAWLQALSLQLAGYSGVDGQLDGLWACRRSNQVFIYNSTDQPVDTESDGQAIEVAPHTIWFNQSAGKP